MVETPNKNSKIIALLPMKAHSERVPNKNIREFSGRPLYHSIMKSLLASDYIKEVIINTDSEIIARDAIAFFERVRIIERPKDICGDSVEMNRIIQCDVSQSEGEHFLQTHSTNPLLSTEIIDRAIEKYFAMLKKGFDTLFSVTRIQTRLYGKNGKAINHNPEELIRTQDLPPVYEENSCLYIFSRTSFDLKKRRIGSKPFLFEISRGEAWDIDEELDFQIAEFLYKQRHSD